MTGLRSALLFASFACVLGGIAVLSFVLAKKEPAKRPELGNRGLQRARALNAGATFRALEPVIRYLAVCFQGLPLRSVRPRLRRALIHSGDYMGLSDDEFLALSVLFGVSLGLAGVCGSALVNLHPGVVPLATILGTLAPWFRLLALGRKRAKRVDHDLPSAVELAAMCMRAGLDFPGSLRRIVDAAINQRAPVIEEFSRTLQEMELGHTRRSAMESFQLRVPTDQVREFANSVIQAEEKGSPLAPVLTIQAQTQRLRRSVVAEESASAAALMLMGPMTMIFLCVIVLLLGPVVVRFMTGGLGPQ